MRFGWLQSDEIKENIYRYSSCDMLYSHTKFSDPKILQYNTSSERSNFKDNNNYT